MMVSTGGCSDCPSDATCDTSGSTPKCVCKKDGYQLNGKTGSAAACVDIDECSDSKLNDCDPHATCTNTDGSFECACPSPGFTGDGKTCACAVGYGDASGTCKANDGKSCGSDDDCVHGHCVGTVCCASACDQPGTCHTSDGATCDNGSDCKYKAEDDGTACDDGNACTTGDKCASGACSGDGSMVAAGTKCKDDDMCNMGYACDGTSANNCIAATIKNCSSTPGVDSCHSAECDPKTGCYAMQLDDGASCSSGDPCTASETCSSGTCGNGTPLTCDDHNPCTDDGTCVQGVGCPTPTNNTMPCDDGNPCTTNDQCAGGTCSNSQAVDCNDNNVCTDDSCETSDTSGQPCRNVANTAACNDNNSCTANDVCSNKNCGPSSTLFSACGPNATGCTQGNPNTCTCATDFIASNGQCVPNTDECQTTADPCIADTSKVTCLDTSPNPGGVQCTCKAGYAGDGTTAGSGCTPCTEPNIAVKIAGGPATACVCDMTGTFAVQITNKTSWPQVTVLGLTAIESGTNVETTSWALRKQSYDANGNLSIVTIPCGGTTPNLCSPVLTAEYGQYLTNQMWATTQVQDITAQTNLAYTIPQAGGSFALPNATANQPYTEPQIAGLIGIHLDDPLGTWPAARSQVGSDSSHKGSVNGAYWVDPDLDSNPGATSYAVPPNGVSADGVTPDPPRDYTNANRVCPRNSSGGPYPYAYLPSPVAAQETIKEFFLGSRATSNLSGTIKSCDLIQGAVQGPDGATNQAQTDGQLKTELRFNQCINTSNTQCMDSTLDGATVSGTAYSGLDTQPQTQHVTSAAFTIVRVPGTTTCADARNTVTYPAP